MKATAGCWSAEHDPRRWGNLTHLREKDGTINWLALTDRDVLEISLVFAAIMRTEDLRRLADAVRERIGEQLQLAEVAE